MVQKRWVACALQHILDRNTSGAGSLPWWREKLEADVVYELYITRDMKCWIYEVDDFYVIQIKQRVVVRQIGTQRPKMCGC